ncbi:hypothetical protein [Paramicrobacterium humi]|uniref:hypothetical protein n=1 Tax=Paramicrobacterium humi TaxID=640635 RepID=UPI0015A13BAA|nr:hypothetical protein [Microbacterium humi]
MSVYSAQADNRRYVAAAAAQASVPVHVDVILARRSRATDARWEHVGVSMDDLDDIAGFGGAIDVHLMVLGEQDDSVDTALQQTLARVMLVRPRSVSLSSELLNRTSAMAAELRSLGVAVWLEIGCREPVDILEDFGDEVDGVLVMLIETGTSQRAQVQLLAKIAPIRARTAADFGIGIDGGVTKEIAAQALRAGASIAVSGRALLAAN